MSDFDKLDLNNIDLEDSNTRDILNTTFSDWIYDAFTEMEKEGMISIWYRNQMYYEGYMTPVGMTNDALTNFVSNNKDIIDMKGLNANTFNTKVKQQDKLFFQDNKITEIIDSRIGEFSSAKKLINVENDNNPNNDKVAEVLKPYLLQHEKKEQVWQQYRIPNIELMMINGLGWGKISYNPYTNIPEGKIIYESIHPTDVAVDPKSNGSRQRYFLDCDYVIQKKRFTKDSAIKFLKEFDIEEDKVSADNDYYMYGNSNYYGNTSEDEEYVTIYFIEYKRERIEEYSGGAKEKLVYYYKVIYNSNLGVIEHKINKYADPRITNAWQYSIFPYYNKQSRVRIYPQSDIEKFIVVQDIINVMKSMILDKGKSRTALRTIIVSKLREKYPDLWDTFEKFGGTFPIDPEDMRELGTTDIRAAIQSLEVPELPKEIYEFLQIAEESFKNQSTRHEALQGKFAERGNSNLSGVAIQKMMEQNRLTDSHKDINIEWVATQEARLIYRIIAMEFTADDFIKIQNAKKGDAKYIPINTTMSIAEFNQYLQAQYPGIPLEQSAKLFDENNDVKVIIPMSDELGNKLQNIDEIESLGAVYINYLKMPDGKGEFKPYDININVSLDFEAERNKIEDRIVANEIMNLGLFNSSDTFKTQFLKLQGGVFETEADKIIGEVNEANRAEQLGKMLIDSGLEQQAIGLMQAQQMQAQNQNQNTNENT